MIATFLSQPVVWGTSVLEAVMVVTLVPMAFGIAGHLVCHKRGCYRLGRFPHGHVKLCAKHHPKIDGHITAAHIAKIDAPKGQEKR